LSAQILLSIGLQFHIIVLHLQFRQVGKGDRQ